MRGFKMIHHSTHFDAYPHVYWNSSDKKGLNLGFLSVTIKLKDNQ